MRKIITLGIMLLFLGMTISSSTGLSLEKHSTTPLRNGNTLYVGGSGPNNYTKIQDAIDDASDGDTVFVYNDSSPYKYVTLVVNKSINLIGEDTYSTIIDGYRDYVIKVYADYVNISGFNIIGRVGVYLEKSSNCIISRNIISTSYYDYCWPIELQESDFNIISRNDISNNNRIEYGVIFVGYSRYNIISGNNISNNDNNGIFLESSFDNTISGNNISNNDGSGILLADSDDNTIIGNNISNNNWDGFCSYGSCRNIISNNIICSNRGNGVQVDSGDLFIYISTPGGFNIISGNIISNNYYFGICIDFICNKNKITGNIITKNNYGGIEIDSAGNTIERNNIANNKYSIIIYHSFNTIFRPNIVKENNFIKNEQYPEYYGIANRWIRNYWDDWDSSSPRPIKGNLTFWGLTLIILIKFDVEIYIDVPWIQFDWHPASEPYDIGV